MTDQPVSADVLIFGGGVAGLWLLDELRRGGRRTLLLESRALGAGQTVASQGIIHGGLKYMFDGKLSPSVTSIAEMPPFWRACLRADRQPDLSGTTILSDGCCIWGTGSFMSWMFLTGSKMVLRAAPQRIEKHEWPAALAGVSGKVLRVPEQVIDPASLLARFAQRNAGSILHIDPAREVRFRRDETGQASEVEVSTIDGQKLLIHPQTVILAAGEGNAALRAAAGLSTDVMQRRPLHMAMVRGKLPLLFGHCVGGPKPRLTITSATDSAGRTIWLVGGVLAEEGVQRNPDELIAHARAELLACIPGLDLRSAEMATYRIDRAEAATTAGQRPDDVQVIPDANILTAWPTKLALAPRLAERILAILPPPSSNAAASDLTQAIARYPAPPVALPPWEEARSWSAVA